ncbi:MAG: 50S ribosomal protein L17 [Nitrospirae bacterium]|nr:MAG: 50S ribosomal protein L17 [Nitrospirota bacterium]
MRHRKSGRQLGRNTHHRTALFRSLVTSLLEHERIETTEAKAKEIRILAERMITLGKDGSLYARRRAAAYIRAKSIVSKLFKEIAGRFSERKGGYTRLIKTRRRVGDAASMVVIELVNRPAEGKDTAKGQPADQKDAGGGPSKVGSPKSKTPVAAGA